VLSSTAVLLETSGTRVKYLQNSLSQERGTWGLQSEYMQKYRMVVPQKKHWSGDSVVLKVELITIHLRCLSYLIPDGEQLFFQIPSPSKDLGFQIATYQTEDSSSIIFISSEDRRGDSD